MTTTRALCGVLADALGIEREVVMDHAAHLHETGMLAEGEAQATVEHAVVPAPTRQGLGRPGRPEAGIAQPVDRRAEHAGEGGHAGHRGPAKAAKGGKVKQEMQKMNDRLNRLDREFVQGAHFRRLLRFAQYEGLLAELMLEEGIPLPIQARQTEFGLRFRRVLACLHKAFPPAVFRRLQ